MIRKATEKQVHFLFYLFIFLGPSLSDDIRKKKIKNTLIMSKRATFSC